MTKVTFTGWVEGFNKVGLTRLLQDKADFDLAQAKHCVDRLLDGEEIPVMVPDDIADTLVYMANNLGAQAQVEQLDSIPFSQ